MANAGKLRAFDHDLNLRLEHIRNQASELELCLTLVQHEANEFGNPRKNGEQVCEQLIKTEVMDVVTHISQNQLQNIEKSIETIKSTFEVLKQNMKTAQAFDQVAA